MRGNTRWLWTATGAAALTNVGMNVALIPSLGSWAAAIDTAIAYGVLLAGMLWFLWRGSGPRIRYETKKIALGVSASAFTGIVGVVFLPASGIEALTTRGIVLVALGLGLYLSSRTG
jgi:O-antigen/teichoic acid export membrane protein